MFLFFLMLMSDDSFLFFLMLMFDSMGYGLVVEDVFSRLYNP